MKKSEGAWIIALLTLSVVLVIGLTKEIDKLREEACKYNLAKWKTVDEKTGKAEFVWITNGVEVVENIH
jgi:hypothetical protein